MPDPKQDLMIPDPMQEEEEEDPFEVDPLAQIETELTGILDEAAVQPASAEPPAQEPVQPPAPAELQPVVHDAAVAAKEDMLQAAPVPAQTKVQQADQPKQPKKQAQKPKKQDPLQALAKYATTDVRKAFVDFITNDPAARQTWENGTTTLRKEIIKTWIDREATKFAVDAVRAVGAPKMTPRQRKVFYDRLIKRRKQELLQQLTPMLGVNLATSVVDPLASPQSLPSKVLRQARLPVSQEELFAWVKSSISSNERLKQQWLQAQSAAGHKDIVKSLRAQYMLKAKQALLDTPEYQALPAKQKKEVLKTFEDTIKLQFDAIIPQVAGDYLLVQDPQGAAKEAINAKTASDETTAGILNYAGVAIGSAISGTGDLLAFSGDVMAYITGDGSWRDMALAKIGHDIAEFGQKVQEESMPEYAKQELAQLQEKLQQGKIVDAFSGLSWSTYALLGAQMLGYVAGSGGVAGGARAAAVKFATAKSIGASLRVQRVTKALGSEAAKKAAVAVGVGAAQGAEAGREVAQSIAEAPIEELKATPGWAMMVEKLTAAYGRPPSDVEVRKALANLHAARAAVHGAAISTAATLLLGGVTENAIGLLPNRLGRAIFSPASGRTTRLGTVASTAVREGSSELVEEGGLEAVKQMQIAQATGRPVDERAIAAAGLTGAYFGTLFGGAIGLATPVIKDNVTNDPDIVEAVEEAQAQAVEAIRIANQKAGNKPPKELESAFSDLINPGDFKFMYEVSDNEIKLANIKGKLLRKVGNEFYFDDKKIDPADTYWGPIIAEAERQAELAPGTLYKPPAKPETGEPDIRSPEALDVPDERLVDANERLEELFDREVKGKAEAEPEAPPSAAVNQEPPPGMDNGDLARAYVHMLVKSGEPEGLAVQSAIKTFGKRNVPDDILETYKDVDLEAWAKAVEPLQAKADPKHVEELKAALPTEGRYYVVASAAEMPGMNPGAAIASFNINGGKDAFTVINAAVIKSKRHLQQVFTAHHALRGLLSPHAGDMVLKGALKSIELGMTLRVKRPTKKGYLDYTPEHPPRVKNPKAKTAQEIIRAYQERLRRGDKEALRGMKEAINELLAERGMPEMGRYVSYSQLWRTLLEVGIIPRTELADVAAAPPGTPPPPRHTLPGGGGKDGGAKKAKPIAKSITHEGWLLKVIGWADAASKLTTLRSLIEAEGVHEDVRANGYEFINAARSMSSIMSEYGNFIAHTMVALDKTIQKVAKQTGLTEEEVRAKYNDYRLARHAMEREETLWATLVPLGSKEAEAKRAALITSILDGTADPRKTMQEIIKLAESSNPAVPKGSGHYGGMSFEEAQSIIDAIKAYGYDKAFEEIDREFDILVDMMRRWEEQHGTYAGPSKNMLQAYGWKYYTPLFDTKEKKELPDETDTEEVVNQLFNPVNLKRRTAEGRDSIEHIDIWTNFELAARNAAYRAALARTVQAMRGFVKSIDENGFEVQVAKIDDAGRVEYKPGDGSKPPSWHIPVKAATQNPRVFNVYNHDTGRWERVTVYDKDIAKILRDQTTEEFIFNSRKLDKAMRAIGDVTRWFAKGLTAYNPRYWFTASYRDLVQTTVLLASQKGLNPAKAAAQISKRLSFIGDARYMAKFVEFLRADAKRREELANDPEFLKTPGMDRLVERWRNGGLITFAAQVGEAETRVTRGYGVISKKMRQKLRETMGAEAYATIESKLQAVEDVGMILDNIHRQVAYDMLRESGASEAEAALWARDIMDFNKRSNWGTRLNQMWAFANAGMIGATTVLSNHLWKKGAPPLKTEVGPDGQLVVKFDNSPERLAKELNLGAVGYFMLAGALRVAIVAALLGDDEDGEPLARKISAGTWMMYEVWPVNVLPGADKLLLEPIKLPKQYGLHQIFEGIGTALALWSLGLADTQEISIAGAEMLAANFVPVGRLTFPASMAEGGAFDTGEFIRQMFVNFSPTAGTALVELGLGRDTFGQKLNPDVTYTQAADYTRAFVGTPYPYEWIAKFAYEQIGLDISPQEVEVLVRDGVPILGPIMASLNRFAVSILSRPERTWFEDLLSSPFLPLPKVSYDMRYDYTRVMQRIRSQYIKPVTVAIDTVRAQYKHNPAERQRRLNRIYKENPWYRPVINLHRSYAERLSRLRTAVRDARKRMDFERAMQAWREYNELRKQRTAETVRLLQAYGVEVDY